MYTLDKLKRSFLPESLEITWQSIEPYFIKLENKTINSVDDLEIWLKERSELEAVLEEDFAWRYIRMTCDTRD